jgi:hypothetical protein
VRASAACAITIAAILACLSACALPATVSLSISATDGPGGIPSFQLIDKAGREVARGDLNPTVTSQVRPGEYLLVVFVRGHAALPTFFDPGTINFNPHAPGVTNGSCSSTVTVVGDTAVSVEVHHADCDIGVIP